MVGALALAACGSDGEATADAESPTTEARAEAFPVTIDHTYGETTIDEAPERIVTVGLDADCTGV